MRVPLFVRSASHFAQPVALVVALVLVVMLARQNSALRLENVRNRVQAKAPRRNAVLPAFHTRTLAGDSAEVGRGSPEVLFFFTTSCAYCKQTLPVWETIAARIGHAPLRVYGVAMGGDSLVRAYAKEHAIHFTVVQFPDSTTQLAYRVDAVPVTLVVNRYGRILLSRLGQLDTPAAVDSVVHAALAADSFPKFAPDSTLTRRS